MDVPRTRINQAIDDKTAVAYTARSNKSFFFPRHIFAKFIYNVGCTAGEGGKTQVGGTSHLVNQHVFRLFMDRMFSYQIPRTSSERGVALLYKASTGVSLKINMCSIYTRAYRINHRALDVVPVDPPPPQKVSTSDTYFQ